MTEARLYLPESFWHRTPKSTRLIEEGLLPTELPRLVLQKLGKNYSSFTLKFHSIGLLAGCNRSGECLYRVWHTGTARVGGEGRSPADSVWHSSVCSLDGWKNYIFGWIFLVTTIQTRWNSLKTQYPKNPPNYSFHIFYFEDVKTSNSIKIATKIKKIMSLIFFLLCKTCITLITNLLQFSHNLPLWRLSIKVAMSVCPYVCFPDKNINKWKFAVNLILEVNMAFKIAPCHKANTSM